MMILCRQKLDTQKMTQVIHAYLISRYLSTCSATCPYASIHIHILQMLAAQNEELLEVALYLLSLVALRSFSLGPVRVRVTVRVRVRIRAKEHRDRYGEAQL